MWTTSTSGMLPPYTFGDTEARVPDRTTYHHGDLRAALIEAGLDLTRCGGPGALTIREVTRRVGVSPNAAYRHFADRDSLLEEVRVAIHNRMADGMAPDDPRAGPMARLRAVGMGYVEFALSEPGWFSVAFFGEPAADHVARPFPAPLWELLSTLDRMVYAGQLSPAQRIGAEWSCFAAVHGFAELALHGPLKDRPHDELRHIAGQVVDTVIAGVTTYVPPTTANER